MLMHFITPTAKADFPRHRWLSRITSLVLFLSVTASGFPVRAEFNPPVHLGRPGNREGAATRGPCIRQANEAEQQTLIALVPGEGKLPAVGLTIASQPTFVWFVPASRARALEFTLYAVDEQMRDQEPPLYRATVEVTGSAGFESLTLPTTAALPPLELNRDYHWQISLICNPDEPSANVTADGWIRRIEPSTRLKDQLANAKSRERSLIYAEAGLWYDALAELLTLRRADATNLSLAMDWSNLLRSRQVQLDAVADQPLTPP